MHFIDVFFFSEKHSLVLCKHPPCWYNCYSEYFRSFYWLSSHFCFHFCLVLFRDWDIIIIVDIFFHFLYLLPIWMAYVSSQTLIKLVFLLNFENFFSLKMSSSSSAAGLQFMTCWHPWVVLAGLLSSFLLVCMQVVLAAQSTRILCWFDCSPSRIYLQFATIAITDLLLFIFCSCGISKCPTRSPIPKDQIVWNFYFCLWNDHSSASHLVIPDCT